MNTPRELILSEPDVRELLELEQIGPDLWRYLIATPFETFPKYVIGTTNSDCTTTHLELRCGNETNAREAWLRSPALP